MARPVAGLLSEPAFDRGRACGNCAREMLFPPQLMRIALPLLSVCGAVATAHAALVGHYRLDSASGLQLDTAGVPPAADAYAVGTLHVYGAGPVPGGNYGAIALPAGAIAQSAGFPSSIATNSTAHWAVSTTAGSGTVTAPTRFNDLKNNFTVMGWVKPATITGTHRIFSTQVSGVTNHSWGFGVTAQKLRFTDYGQYDLDSAAAPVVVNQWQHIAAVKSASGVSLYHNGTLIHSDTARTADVTSAPNASTTWRLLNGPNNEIWIGSAADIRVYDTALTQSEILLAAGHNPTPTGDLANDFAPPDNPYLGFSHGVKTSPDAAVLTLFAGSASATANKPATRLNDAADTLWVGRTASTAVGPVAYPAAGGVPTVWLGSRIYHAWSGGRTDALTSRCTIATAGNYDLRATWRVHTEAGAKAQVHVVHNGAVLFTAGLDGFAGSALSPAAKLGALPETGFALPGAVFAAGDTVDVVTVPDAGTPAGNIELTFRVLPRTGPPLATGGVVISELCASNVAALADEDGDYPDWIELYNGSGAAVDLTGWSLTDKANTPRKWMFPPRRLAAGEYLVVFASEKNGAKNAGYGPLSELHTNFQLSAGGEYLGLVNAAGAVVDQFAPGFPAQVADVAYGRAGTAGPATGYLLPTPGGENGPLLAARPGNVTFSVPSGVFVASAPQSVTLSVNPAGQTIRYTTDNSEPTLANGATWTGTPVNVTSTTVIRARAYADGVAGPLAEARYLFVDAAVQPSAADSYTLPVLVIDTLGGGALGDFASGTEDPQKAAMLALFEPVAGRTDMKTAPTVLSRGGSHVRGQSSSTYKKQGFDLEFWDEYGSDRGVALLGMPEDGDWAVYAPYEFDRTYLNNRLAYEWAARMGRYAPRTKFVELYVNTDGGALSAADYYGVYVLVETVERGGDRIDVARMSPADNSGDAASGGYVISINRGNEPEVTLAASLPFMRNMRQSRTDITITNGMNTFLEYPEMDAVTPAQKSYIESWLKLTEEAIYGANFTHPTTGLPYTDYIGRDTFIDYHLAQTIPQNIDALRLSTYFSKDRGGKLKAGPVWDYDRAMSSKDNRNANPSVWDTQTSTDKTEYFHYGWWHRLFQDADFMQLWVDRYAELRKSGEVFDLAGSMLPLIDAFAAEVAPVGSTVNAQTRDYARWPSGAGGSGTGLSSGRAAYATEVNTLKTWLTNRMNFIDGQVLRTPASSLAAGTVPAGSQATLTVTGSAGAQIWVTTDGSDPRLPGGGLNPTAVQVATGSSVTLSSSALLRWRQRDLTAPAFNSDSTSTKMSRWSAPGEAYYVIGAQRPAPGDITVSQLHYHPSDPSGAEVTAGFDDADDFEFIELMNISGHRLNLEGCRFTEGFDFTVGAVPTPEFGPGERLILVKNRAAALLRYGAETASRLLGEFAGNDNLENAGEGITLLAADGVTTLLSFAYSDRAPWPTAADGTGPSLVLVNPAANPDLSEAVNWRLSSDSLAAPSPNRLSYQAWLAALPPGLDADADGDGLLLPVEYALGTDPQTSSTAGAPTFTPQPDGSFTVSFSRPLVADDAAWQVETSADLTTWTPVATTVESQAVAGGVETLVVRTAADTAPAAYARLRFTIR